MTMTGWDAISGRAHTLLPSHSSAFSLFFYSAFPAIFSFCSLYSLSSFSFFLFSIRIRETQLVFENYQLHCFDV